MRPSAAVVVTAALAWGCGKDAGFDAVLIRPMTGWADGCTDVKVTGRGFGDDVKVTIGGTPLENANLPAKDSLDYGFQVTGTTPSNGTGAKGWADVVVTTGGETATIEGVYYYAACPAPGYIEAVDPEEGVAAGTAITMYGCNLDAGAYSVRVGDSADVTLTSECNTATVTFAAPAPSADDTWYIGFFDSAGTQVSPDPACDITMPAGSNVPPDTADTGWVDPCSGAATLTYGGAK